jgi:large subunit ribosomal protein L37Ae
LAILSGLGPEDPGSKIAQNRGVPKIRAAPFFTPMAKSKLGPTKRFGARYGRTVKHKVAKIERIMKQKHACPYCSKQQVKRKSAGIWHCKKCNSTFTGRAYTPERKQSMTQKTQEYAILLEEEA